MPPNDTSDNRTYQQLPNTVSGYNSGTNTAVDQIVSVSATWPGVQIVTVSGGADRISLPPYKGQLLVIDARASTKNVSIQTSPANATSSCGTSAAIVAAGSFMLVLSDGVGWVNVPNEGGLSVTETTVLPTMASLPGYDIDADPLYVTPVGGFVPTLIERGPNARVFSAAGAARPVYIQAVGSTPPSLRYDAIATVLTAASALTLNYDRTQPFTAYLVVKSTSANGSQTIFSKGGPITTGWGVQIGNGGSSAFLRTGVSNNAANSMVVDVAQVTLNTLRMYVVTYDGLSRCDGVECYSNGIKIGNNDIRNTLTLSSLNGNMATLGSDGGASRLGGDLFRAVIYKANHTTAQRGVGQIILRTTYPGIV